MAYREPEQLRSYGLKSSRLHRVVLAAVGIVSLPVAVLGVGLLFHGRLSGFLAFFPSAMFAIYFIDRVSHTVPGGEARLEIYRGRINVPPAWAARKLEFPMNGTDLRVDTIRGYVVGNQVSEVKVLRLRADSLRRDLSSRLFESRAAFDQAVDDLLRLQGGEDLGPVPETPDEDGEHQSPDETSCGRERDELDEEIDRELAEME